MSGNDLRELMGRYRAGADQKGEARRPRRWMIAAVIVAVAVLAGVAWSLVVWQRTRRTHAAETSAKAPDSARGRRIAPLIGYAYTWSPDGKWIAYFAPSAEDNNPTLWRVSPSGKSRRRIPAEMSLPYRLGGDASRARIGLSWGPHGTQLACGPALPLSGRAWTVDLSSRLTWDLGIQYAAPPHWSPDGRELAFVHRGFDQANRRVSVALLLVSADGDEEREIGRTYSWPPRQVRHGPVWSPDGKRIIVPWDRAPVTGSPAAEQGPVVDAWLVDRDGSDPHPLATAWDHQFPGDGERRIHCEYTHQCWSPDGDHVVVSAFDETDRWRSLGLFRISIATQRAEPLLPESVRRQCLSAHAAPRYPTWSLQGDRIAFVGAGRLCVLAVQEARCQSLNTGHHVLNAPPLWSPDGKRILYAAPAASGQGTDLCVVTVHQ